MSVTEFLIITIIISFFVGIGFVLLKIFKALNNK